MVKRLNFLQRIDFFVRKKDDPGTRTSLGGLFTVFLPLIIAGYITVSIITLTTRKPQVTFETVSVSDQVFSASLNCTSPEGCYVTDSYSSVVSNGCVRKIKEENLNPFMDICRYYPAGAAIDLHFCFTTNPNDGPRIAWKRNQDCDSAVYDDISGTVSCSSGVKLELQSISLSKNFTFVTSSTKHIDLFYGTHAFQYQEWKFFTVADTSSKPDAQSWSLTPFQLSSETILDNTNACCPRDFSSGPKLDAACHTNGDMGTANDHYEFESLTVNNVTSNLVRFVSGLYYQVQIRTFPTYQVTNYVQDDGIFLGVINTVGSFYTVVIWLFSCVLLIFRLATETQTPHSSNVSLDEKKDPETGKDDGKGKEPEVIKSSPIETTT